jgi:hypothetical protein
MDQLVPFLFFSFLFIYFILILVWFVLYYFNFCSMHEFVF